MKYKSLGWDTTVACTPPGRTYFDLFDNRSCRERNNCTRECHPKLLKCQWCGEMNSSLNVLEKVETSTRISICDKCKDKIRSEIVR
jgi:hypothetical protein